MIALFFLLEAEVTGVTLDTTSSPQVRNTLYLDLKTRNSIAL